MLWVYANNDVHRVVAAVSRHGIVAGPIDAQGFALGMQRCNFFVVRLEPVCFEENTSIRRWALLIERRPCTGLKLELTKVLVSEPLGPKDLPRLTPKDIISAFSFGRQTDHKPIIAVTAFYPA